jgi:hypothetical protein
MLSQEAFGVQYFNIGLHTRGAHGVHASGPKPVQCHTEWDSMGRELTLAAVREDKGRHPQEGQYWTRAEQQNRPDAPSVWQIGVPLSTSFPFCLYAYPSYLRREEKHHCKRRGSSTGARLHHCSTTHFTDTQLQSLVYLAVGSEAPVLGSIDSLDAFSKFLATRVYNNKVGAPGRIYLRQRPRLISIFNCRQQLQEGSSRNGRLITGSCFIFQKDCYLGRPSASALGIFSRRLIVLDSHGSSDAGTTIIRTTST